MDFKYITYLIDFRDDGKEQINAPAIVQKWFLFELHNI